jgi:hypothetical protein
MKTAAERDLAAHGDMGACGIKVCDWYPSSYLEGPRNQLYKQFVRPAGLCRWAANDLVMGSGFTHCC